MVKPPFRPRFVEPNFTDPEGMDISYLYPSSGEYVKTIEAYPAALLARPFKTRKSKKKLTTPKAFAFDTAYDPLPVEGTAPTAAAADEEVSLP